jgi:hypothetical protein
VDSEERRDELKENSEDSSNKLRAGSEERKQAVNGQ